ncbi:type IV secretory system conjugative DNA transfer family protein [Pseudonocardia charpentierae]|uniref:TraM recognition domain-containing protein n=1 Tax=Pseudonocardia charpentierae TaxID=3075545 RepID=A0ABU2N2J1_9PSEU|nr:TraM recognition domain-containing protein [Pseudonocardia sp. DSM 45834]MDT0348137.1 TraM recognition domain-containing protein [Pseudonocardia sp. DSM 45834]
MTTGYLILFTFAAVASVVLAWRRRAWLVTVGLALFALYPTGQLVDRTPVWLLVAIVVLTVVVAWHRFFRTSATVTRWGARIRRKSGVASTFDIARVGSGMAMRRKAATVRPSLSRATRRARWWQLLRLPTREVALQLCKVGLLRVWISSEDVLVVFGGPRTGKTQYLAGRIIDAPGAVLVTSTRTDLYEVTAPLRARRGPVYVFNATGLAGLQSTITFDPLTGCTDPVTAAERAADMLGAVSAGTGRGGAGEREFWDAQARRVLAALMHAAALGGASMRDVHAWVSDPDAGQARITSLLRRSPEKAFETDVAQFVSTNSRTRTSITSTIMPALGWLAHPAAAAAAQPSSAGFDVAELLESRATVYLLGGEEAQAAPLVCALTGHIARQARTLAALQPGGRLDPALTLALDEAALISPVPLQRWTADMGGRGVTIVAAFQSRAQLLARYGDNDAAVILNNAAAALLFGGTRDRDDLQFWSTLAGDRDEPVLSTDVHGHRSTRTVRKVPVLAPAQLANLPTGRVVAFRRGMAPVIGRAEQAHRRRDVRTVLTGHTPWWTRLLAALARGLARLRLRRPLSTPTVRPELVDDDPWVIPPEWTATSGPTGDGDPGEPGRWS